MGGSCWCWWGSWMYRCSVVMTGFFIRSFFKMVKKTRRTLWDHFCENNFFYILRGW